MWPLCHAPLRETNIFRTRFCELYMYPLATSNTRTLLVSRFSLSTIAVWHIPDRCPHRPHHGHTPQLRGLLFPVKSYCCCRQVKCKCSVRGLFFISFCGPQFSTNCDHWSTSELRCRPLPIANLQGINLERNTTSSCDEPLTSRRRSPVSTNQPKF